MKKQVITVLMVLGLTLLMAQSSIFGTNPFNQENTQSSLFNPYKLKMSHSMGFSAATGSNGLGIYESRYTNHIKYEFNSKLNLELDINLVNYGTATTGKGFNFESNDDNKTRILPEFSLNYQPTKSISLRLEYRNHNNYYPWLRRSQNWLE